MMKFFRKLAFVLVVFIAVAACAASGDVNAPSKDVAAGEIGGMCGGVAGIQCAGEGAYCNVEPGVCREVADYAGVCAPKPEICTKDYRPVCGCDGQTYSNACMAAVVGANVAHAGECRNYE